MPSPVDDRPQHLPPEPPEPVLLEEVESRRRYAIGTNARITCWWTSYSDHSNLICYILVERWTEYHDPEPSTSVLYSRLESDMIWKRCALRREEIPPEVTAMLEAFWYITD